MIKKINNQQGKADTIKAITDKCNDNFEYLESLINDLGSKDFAFKKDIKLSFNVDDVIGFKENVSTLNKNIEEKQTQINNLSLQIQELQKLILDTQRTVLNINTAKTEK
jgi:predicted  nucleic acid-binding Zn-ribbon protein